MSGEVRSHRTTGASWWRLCRDCADDMGVSDDAVEIHPCDYDTPCSRCSEREMDQPLWSVEREEADDA